MKFFKAFIVSVIFAAILTACSSEDVYYLINGSHSSTAPISGPVAPFNPAFGDNQVSRWDDGTPYVYPFY